jgi:hypothetical protein
MGFPSLPRRIEEWRHLRVDLQPDCFDHNLHLNLDRLERYRLFSTVTASKYASVFTIEQRSSPSGIIVVSVDIKTGVLYGRPTHSTNRTTGSAYA